MDMAMQYGHGHAACTGHGEETLMCITEMDKQGVHFKCCMFKSVLHGQGDAA
jgi:hypothetical protein